MVLGGAALRQRLGTARDALDEFRLPRLLRLAARGWARLGLTRTGQIAAASAVVPWVVGRVVAGTTLYLLAYGIAVVVASAFFLAPRRLRLTASREGLFPRVQKGDRLEVSVTLRADRTVTAFHFEEAIPEELGPTVRVPVAKVRAGETFSYSYGLHCARRGVFKVGPLAAITHDPIGVAERRSVLVERFELVVHPRVYRVTDHPLTRLYEDPPVRPPVSRPWPSGLELFGLREFREGDEPRRVVWRAVARTGRLMVSEAEQGVTDQVTLLLDTDRRRHRRDGDASESFERAVSACASLALRHLSEGYVVTCEANSGRLTRPLRGAAYATALLDVMARVTTERSELGSGLRRVNRELRRDAHVVIVTPQLRTEDVALLRVMAQKGVSITVVGVLWEEAHAEGFGAARSCAEVAVTRAGEDLGRALAGADATRLART